MDYSWYRDASKLKQKDTRKRPNSKKKRRTGTKVSDRELYNSVKARIVLLLSSRGRCVVHAESFANAFDVQIHRITQVFKKLNQEGWISRHREVLPLSHFNEYAWTAKSYLIHKPKSKSNAEAH